MSIIIMNLLVGLAVDDIASVMRVATVKRLAMRVRLTLDVERKLPLKCLFRSIRRFRAITYKQPRWHRLVAKLFAIQMRTNFDKNFTRLENYNLIPTAGVNQDSKDATMNFPSKMESTNSSTMLNTNAGLSSDWINNIHSQITTKYNEFNQHLTDLKNQQERINQILQQFPPSIGSRHGSQMTFSPSSV